MGHSDIPETQLPNVGSPVSLIMQHRAIKDGSKLQLNYTASAQ
jgi:hypothetical protein